MPRHDGHTANREHRKHGGHRMHRRTALARRQARVRPARRTWDRDRWLDQMDILAVEFYPGTEYAAPMVDLYRVVRAPLPEAGRKNHPRPAQKPQKPKRPKGEKGDAGEPDDGDGEGA